MDATLKKIIRLLSDERMDRRYAAVIVLGELRVSEASAAEGLAPCLAEDNRVLQIAALEALANIRSKKVMGLALPLLDSPDEEIRSRAVALVASQGSQAAAILTRELHKAPLARRRVIAGIMARHHDEKSFDALIDLLADAEMGEQVLSVLRAELEHMSSTARALLLQKTAARLKDTGWLKEPQRTAWTLRLLGYQREARLVRTLLPFAQDRWAVPVRRAALAALRRPLAASRAISEAFCTLLRHADDPDPALARAAVDTLRNLPVPAEVSRELLDLTEGRHAEARAFAVEALGRIGDSKVVRTLVEHLGGDDPSARDAAFRALSHRPAAAPALLRELEQTRDPQRAENLCRLLHGQAHGQSLPPASLRVLLQMVERALDESWLTTDLLLSLLAGVAAKQYIDLLLSRARALGRASKHREAFALLGRLEEDGLLDEEGHYLALVSGLSALSSKKELGRANRSTDPVLRHAATLISKGFPLASSMSKDRALDSEDLFFVGFNFAESKDEDEKELGCELLAHLAETSPRSKLGKSAKNKLRLVGEGP